MHNLKLLAKKYAVLLKNVLSVLYVNANKYSKIVISLIKKVVSLIFSNTVVFLKRCPRVFAAVLTVILVFSCTVTVVLATGATSAYAVVCNGETIAIVKDSSILAEAENFAVNKLNNPVCVSHLIKPTLAQTIAGEKNLASSNELADCIIKHSKDIVSSYVLKVDGNVVAFGRSSDEINLSLDEYLLKYKQGNNVDNVAFSKDYEISENYILNSEFKNLPTVADYLNSKNNLLSVETITVVVIEEDVPFKTVETETNTLLRGSKKITKNGVNGKKETTYKVYSLDGVETKRVAESEIIITEPIAQEVLVGTKKEEPANNNSGKAMCWPVKRVESSYVSSYMGDGRGHKGMDIVAPAGTPIYAAEGGTVTFAGWDSSGYGYKILIQHANGYETLYAHCSKLYVKKGDVVVTGENIAAVGTTGRSAGNHLHFEVHLNGSIKNPANYIGRK